MPRSTKMTVIPMPRSAETSWAVSPPPGRNATAAATATTIRTLRSVLFTTPARVLRTGRALRGQRAQLGGELVVAEAQRRGRRAVGRLGHRGRGLALCPDRTLDRLGREAVPDAEVRVDVAPIR